MYIIIAYMIIIRGLPMAEKEKKQFDCMEKGLDTHQAIAEAARCLMCHDAPCSRGCPAGTDPGSFIRKLRLRNITGAYRTIKTNNILGGSCGILCPSEKLCEKECSATEIDRPIQIGKLQRYIVEQGWKLGLDVIERESDQKKKVAVIGSGPAGIACAAEVAKHGYHCTVFESKEKPGGVMRYGVPEHRYSEKFLDQELDDIRKLGVEFMLNTCISGKKGAETLLEKGYDAVFLAPGLWKPIRLIDKEMDGVSTSTDFLQQMKADEKKVSEKVKGKKAAVIGGGSVAIDCVESLLKAGASDVYLIYRRSYNQMPAEESEKLDALKSGAHFLLLNQPLDYVSKDGRLQAVKLVRTRLGETDSSGRRSPENVAGSEWLLEIDYVVEAIGSKPESFLRDIYPSVASDSKDYVSVRNETMETSVKGIFAGGDIVNGPALIINAVHDGKAAGKAIAEFLNNGGKA